MKETYVAPELTCLCLLPAEAVALTDDGFDDYLGGGTGDAVSTGGVVVDPDDIDIDLT